MMNRRRFFGTSLGLGIGKTLHLGTPGQLPVASETNTAMNGYEQALAGYDRLDVLGIPRSWSVVRDGFHPIPPERVVICASDAPAYLACRNDDVRNELKARIKKCVVKNYTWLQGRFPYSEAKLDSILSIVNTLTTFYRRPDLFETWCERGARREALGSTGMGRGFSLLDQFPDRQTGFPELANPPADWWAFLFPSGTDWNSLDDQPLYVMLGAVYSHQFAPSLGLPIWCFIEQCMHAICESASDHPDWEHQRTEKVREIAQMDRVTAARTLNRYVAKGLLKRTP